MCPTFASPARPPWCRRGTGRNSAAQGLNGIKPIEGNRSSCFMFSVALNNFESCIARTLKGHHHRRAVADDSCQVEVASPEEPR